MNRRIFLASALAAGTTLAADTPVKANGRRVKIAFLGGSYSHTKGKLQAIRNSSEFDLVGLWDGDASLCDSCRSQGIRILGRDELLNNGEVEVIAVGSDPPDHARHAMMVLDAGRHVHIEKPPAMDVSSFRSILETADRKNRIVQLGYMWRHHPGFRRIFEMVRSGWLGDVYFVKTTINKMLNADRRPEWSIYRGGLLYELGSHVIDQVVRLMGRPNRITPFLKKHGRFDDNLVDNTVAVFEYSNAVAVVMGTALQPNSSRYRSFVVQGTLGTATLQPIEPPTLEVDLEKAAGPYKKGVQTVNLPPYERFIDDFKELAAAIRGEKPIAVTPQEDIMVQEALIEASGM